jgi:hypothetical protein
LIPFKKELRWNGRLQSQIILDSAKILPTINYQIFDLK